MHVHQISYGQSSISQSNESILGCYTLVKNQGNGKYGIWNK